jgi:polysaccharide biosynthesis transport protein
MPLSLLRMVWKHKVLVVLLWAVISAMAATLVHSLPSIYEAQSLIMVDAQKVPEKFVPSTVQISLQDSLETVRQQILSSTRLQKIIDEFGLYTEERHAGKSPEEIIDKMRKDISTPMAPGWGAGRPGAFSVIYRGRDPKVVAAVVNEISGLFLEEDLKARELRAQGTFDFIDSQLQEAKKSLEEQEGALSRYKVQRLGELPEQGPTLMGNVGRLQAEVQAIQGSIEQDQQTKLLLNNTLHTEEATDATLRAMNASRSATRIAISQTGSTSAVSPDASGAKLSDQIQAQIDALHVRYQNEHPEIRRLQALLKDALEQERKETAEHALRAPALDSKLAVEQIPSSVPPQTVTELAREREQIQLTKAQIAALDQRIASRNAERQRILNQIQELEAHLERLPVREQELAQLTRDYENSKQNYNALLDKKTSAEMSAELEKHQQAERFTLLDPAHVPTKPVKPPRPALYSAAVFVALFIALLGPIAFEFKKNTFLGDWELPADLRVLGHIAVINFETPEISSTAAEHISGV